jgi:hypothetical protein
MAVMTTAKKFLLNKMNLSAKKAGLGDLLAVNVVATGLFTTAGGDANESITVSDVAVGDTCIVTINTVGATPRTVTSATCAVAGTIAVVLSGDPSTDHVLNYVVIRSV